MKKSPGWSLPLTRIVVTSKGVRIETLSDARALMLKLRPGRSTQQHWQHAAKLLLDASESGDAKAASDQLVLALFLDHMLDLEKTPAT